MFSSKPHIRFGSPLVTLLVLFGLLISVVPALAATPGVDPATVTTTLKPGQSTIVNKTVHTPVIPPNPDVVFLSDTTGSMGPAIANVQANAISVMSTVLAAQPTAQFAAAQYKDADPAYNGGGCADPFAFNLDQSITSNTGLVQTGINSWSGSGGCDIPESQLNALYQLATGGTGFRTGSTRIVAWFGDNPGHDPSLTHSLADVVAALKAANIRVVAIPVSTPGNAGLDATGQATAITTATGGVLMGTTDPSQVAAAILTGLSNLPVTVTPKALGCSSPDVTVGSFTPASKTVTSGTDATFTESVAVSAGAGTPPQGTTVTCTVDWLLDGKSQGAAFLQTVKVTVPDVTAPVAQCVETVNPAGNNIPPAGITLPGTKGGQNPDGFYQLLAKDNIDPASKIQTFIRDAGSGKVFGPFPVGINIKYTQAPGATPDQKAIGGPNSAVAWHITGTGDAQEYAVDSSGNASARVSCLVPPPPK